MILGSIRKNFKRRIRGENIKVEHSICGAWVVKENYKDCSHAASSLLMELCIAGHHGGIPDVGTKIDTDDEASLQEG